MTQGHCLSAPPQGGFFLRFSLALCCVLWAVTCYAQTALRPDQISPGTPDLLWGPGGAGYQVSSTVAWRTSSSATPTFSTTDNALIVELTGCPCTSTLPAVFADGSGFAIQVAAGTLTLTAAAAGTLNGGNSLVVGPYQTVTLAARNSKWYADVGISAPGATGGAPTINGVTLSTSNFTTSSSNNGTTIATLTPNCTGSCTGATYALAATGTCAGANSADNGSFTIPSSTSNLNIGSTALNTARNYLIGISVTLAGATNSGTCYPQTLVGAPSSGAPTGNCAESTAFFARVYGAPVSATLDGTVGASIGAGTGHLGAYDALLCNLNASHDNVLSSQDALWITATDDATHTPATAQKIANLNLLGSNFTLIPVGNPPFTANTGYAPSATEGTTGIYLNTQFTPSAGGTHYVLGNALIHAWTFTSFHSNSQYQSMGADDATQTTGISPWTTGATSNFFATLSEGVGAAGISTTVGTSTGSSLVARNSTSSTAGSILLYRNGAVQTTVPTGTPTVGLVTIPLDFGGENYRGTHYASPYQVAAGGFGGNLSGSFVMTGTITTGTGLVARICQYLTAVHGSC
jgi:hypothetical protein